MSNRRKMVTFKQQLTPEEVAKVALEMDGKIVPDRRVRRALRPNRLFASVLRDHHKPHALQDNCGPSCNLKP